MSLHTFTRDGYQLWADRVPAAHSMVNRFTLWGPHTRGGLERIVGGVSMPEIRDAIFARTHSDMKDKL